MEFTADLVWALAVAADRINCGYVREDQWNRNQSAAFLSKQANKHMIKQWLRDGDFHAATEEDHQEGRRVRTHINAWIFKIMTNQATYFERQALKIAQIEVFTGSDLFEFTVISCLPAAVRRDTETIEIRHSAYNEQLAGRVGDEILGDVTVVDCCYFPEYRKWRVIAYMNSSLIYFWFKQELHPNTTVRIKGKIKTKRADSTQLHYVRLI